MYTIDAMISGAGYIQDGQPVDCSALSWPLSESSTAAVVKQQAATQSTHPACCTERENKMAT